MRSRADSILPAAGSSRGLPAAAGNNILRLLISLSLIALVLWPAGTSCALSRNRPPAEAQGGSWELSLGSLGGFTGGGSGHFIRSDGEVHSWTQSTSGGAKTSRRLGRAAAATLEALEKAMSSPDLRSLKHQQSGNMTGFLQWRQGHDLREYSWPEQVDAKPLPEPLKRAYDAAIAVVNSVRP